MALLLFLNSISLSLVSVALGLVTLLQKPKGEGASPIATDSSMKQLLGVAQMPSFLSRVTYILFVLMILLIFSFTYLIELNY